MREYMVYGVTLPDAYHKALTFLQLAPSIPCPEWNTNQKEISVTMVVRDPLRDNMISRMSFCDPVSLEQYVEEMLDGVMDFEIQQGKWAYTYHSRYADQYQFVIDELHRDPWSRRAGMDIRTKDDMKSDDPACWQHVQYFIREDKLHCKVLFRSNDACKAAFMNAFALIMLQKRIADELGVPVGSYTHRANSFHCYERDYQMLNGYCDRIETAESEDELTYSYWDDWSEQMLSAKPEIENKINMLYKKYKEGK